MGESKIKDLERELRLSPAALSDLSDDEKEELKRTVRTLSERYGQLKLEYKKVIESQRDNSDPDGVTKQLQSTIESLKRVASSAQQKLSKKEKEVERLTSMIGNIKNSSDSQNDATQNGLPVKIKEEPAEQVDTEERQIVLNIGNHLVDHDDSTHDSIADPYQFHGQEQGMVEFASSAYMSDTDTRLGSNGSYSAKANTSKAKTVKSKGTLVDVTEHYEESEDDIVCGICEGWDPPIRSESDQQDQENNTKGKKKCSTYNVGWVGCDCGRWYHKQCTSLKRFTASFSCKSVKMKCQKK